MKSENAKNYNLGYIFVFLICCLLMVSLICNLFQVLNSTLLGIFGVAIYFFIAFFTFLSIVKIVGYNLKYKKRFIILLFSIFYVLLTLIQYICFMKVYGLGFIEALNYCFGNITCGGVLVSFLLWPVASITNEVTTIVIFFSVALVLVLIAIDKIYYRTYLNGDNSGKANNLNRSASKKDKLLIGSMQIDAKVLSDNQNKPSFLTMPLTLNAQTSKVEQEKVADYIKTTPSAVREFKDDKIINSTNYASGSVNSHASVFSEMGKQQNSNLRDGKPKRIVHNAIENSEIPEVTQVIEPINNKKDNNDLFNDIDNSQNDNSQYGIQNSEKENFNDEDINKFLNKINKDLAQSKGSEFRGKNSGENDFGATNDISSKRSNIKSYDEEVAEQKPKVQRVNYVRPPLSLLTTISSIPNLSVERFEEKARKIEEKLEEFKINAKCLAIARGPAITRYEFEMPQGVSVNKVLQYSNDLSMVLEAKRAIRLEVPIPGKNAFGIEVPNETIDTVGLRDLIECPDFEKSISPLTFALGKDITNRPIISDLDKLVHTLVAGSTGSGKSVCLNAIIISLLYKSSPQDLRIILIDPKFVEFNIYEKLPHLLLPNIITEPSHAVNALSWVIEEMERRNRLFGQNYVRNIQEYNDMPDVKDGTLEKMYRIVVIVDELADLMLNTRKEIEEKILKLTQKARSSGIFLLLATQRPSVDIITGTIKANLPSRIAFSLTNYNDSKTIIDGGGAEKLLGRGDMLYKPRDINEPIRLLAPFISQGEVASIVDFIKKNNPAHFDKSIQEAIMIQKGEINTLNFDVTDDEYFLPGLRLSIDEGQTSASLLQRRFSIGYNRSSRLIEQMAEMGYIGKQEGSKPRAVYMTMEEFIKLYGDKL